MKARNHIGTILGVLFFFTVVHGAPPVPTTATQNMLNNHSGLRMMLLEDRVGGLYGATIATLTNEPDVDTFLANFIANPANRDALGVDGVTLVPDEFCSGRPRVKCVTSADCAAGEMCGNSFAIGSGMYTVYSYVQTIAGLPVYGSLVKIPVYMGSPKKFSFLSTRLFTLPVPSLPQQVLASGDAVTALQQVVPGSTVLGAPINVVYETASGELRKVWVIEAMSDGSPGRYFVDSVSGKIVGTESMTHEADIEGTVSAYATQGTSSDCPMCNPPNAPVLTTLEGCRVQYLDELGCPDTSGVLLNEVPTGPGGSFQFDTAPSDGRLVATLTSEWVNVLSCLGKTVDECLCDWENGMPPPPIPTCNHVDIDTIPMTINPLFNYPPDPFVTGHVNAFIGVNYSHDWFTRLQPDFRGIDQQVTALINHTGAPPAQYRGDINILTFGRPSTNGRSFAYSTIISHEYGHFIHDSILPISDDRFSEGIADCISSYIWNTPIIAENRIPNNNPSFLRHLDGFCFDQHATPCATNADCPNAGLCQQVILGDSTSLPSWCSANSGIPHCPGMALGGAFWDLRKQLLTPWCDDPWQTPCTEDSDCLIGYRCTIDDAAERILADFLFITDGVLDESIIFEVLVADDKDGDICVESGNEHRSEIISAFGMHGWTDPCALPTEDTVRVGWEGFLPLPEPIEGTDFDVVYHQSNLPIVTLYTTEMEVSEVTVPIDRWIVERVNAQGVQMNIGVVRAEWSGNPHNIVVQIGGVIGQPPTVGQVNIVDVPKQSAATWSSVELNVLNGLGRVQCYSATDGSGGRVSGKAGGIRRLLADAIGQQGNLGGLLSVRVDVDSLILKYMPVGSNLETYLVGRDIVVDGELDGDLIVAGDMLGEVIINGEGTSAGNIRVNGNIARNLGIPLNKSITIAGNMSGDIIADWDGDGTGVITGNISIAGDFSGDVCDANLSAAVWDNQTPQLPSNISIGGAFTGTVCKARTPVKPVALPHSASKNRMLSINLRTIHNHEVALKLELVAMPRCSGDLNRACNTSADCTFGTCINQQCSGNPSLTCVTNAHCDVGPCVDHPDVGTAWWVGEPWDPSCQNELGYPINEYCTEETYLTHVIPYSPYPNYRNWWNDIIHLADCEIVPVATYTLQATEDGTNFTAPEMFKTIDKPNAQWGDVVGPDYYGYGLTPPNGYVNVTDVLAIVLAQIDPQNGPHRTWADLHGPGEGSRPNGMINAGDLQWVVKAAQGDAYRLVGANRDPGECPEFSALQAFLPVDPVPLTISGSDSFLDPEEWLYVDVFTGAVDELGAYEVALEVSGGTSGTLVLADILLDDERSDYVFGTDTTIVAKNVAEGRVGVLRENGGIEVVGTKYLATFVYQPASGASGVFEIALKGEGASFLSDGNGGLLPVTLGSDEVVGVGVDCWETWHCNDNNACTTDACSNYECVFTNATQGTACNDGHFCTATDTCNGSGLCTGTGNPCPPRTHWCNEFQDQCEESLGGED